MTDYRLDGLSPRSFEHFIQALCVKALTETVTPFGDGPDGGREATFDGPTRYGVGPEQWDGYGVVQAKFLQRPTDPTSNGKWVLKELKAELAKYKSRTSERKISYYVLATNIALTSVANVGSKDKVLAELQQFAKKYGLKGVDIWDYDKLRILLDNNEEVRRSYAAWVTPGDVLADLSEALMSQRPDFHRLIINFLQKEMLADQFAKLEQAGHSADEAIPLSQVFVDVPVALEPHSDLEGVKENRESRYFADLIIREASLHCREDHWQVTSEIPSRPIGRHVLIGGPGQGKTTVGQYICQVFRASLLAKVPTLAVDYEALTVVRAIERRWDEGVLAVPGARRIPFRVVLSEFAKSLADGQTNGLLAYLTSLFNARTNANLKVFQFEALLATYPSLLILDGLDEVPASTNRGQVLTAIKEFWADIATSKISNSGIDVLVVATSRPQGYNEDFSPKFYSHHWMTPLSPAQAIEYGGKLAEVRFSGDTDRVVKVQRRIQRAAENNATSRLMRSPLQVTILTLLLDRMGQPPQERWPLFDEYFKLIYQREIERDIPAAAILREYKSNIITVHRQVGLLLQVEVERSGGTDAKLTVEQFRRVVEHHLQEEEHEGEQLARLTNAIIEAAVNRLVFLVGLESGQVGFEIRSLQEFMAAEGIMAASDMVTQSRLKAVAGNTNWRNVFLFAAGKCFFDRQYLRDTIHTVCGELNEDLDDKTARLTLTGSELALDVLEEGSARRQPRWNRLLTRTALLLLDDFSVEWPQRLAEIWQTGTTDMFISEIRARIEGNKPNAARNAWLCLAHLSVYPGAEFTSLLADLLSSQEISADLFGDLLQYGNYASVPLNKFLSGAVLNYPATAFQNGNMHSFLDGRSDVHRQWEAPGWIKSLADLLRGGPWASKKFEAVRIVSRDHLWMRARIPVLERALEIPQEINRFSGGGRGWSVVRAYLDFYKSPSKETLANALKQSAIDPNETIQYRISSMVPWPLREATLAARDSKSLEELANAAESGKLGDIDIWLAWQKNWFDQGITINEIMEGDILASGRSGAPWCPTRVMLRDYRGFPKGLPKDLMLSNDFIEAVCTASAGPGRDFFAQVVARSLLESNPRSFSLALSRVGFFESIIESSWRVGLQCLLATLPEGVDQQRWLTLLAESVSCGDFWHLFFAHSRGAFAIIQQAWLQNVELRELLVVLIQMGEFSSENRQFFERLESLDFSADPKWVKIARMALLLRGLYWNDALLDQAQELITSYPDAFVVLVQAVEISGGPEKQEENILLCLHEVAMATGNPSELLIPALRERIRSRRSVLTTSAAWTSLGFSLELSRLIESNT